jgi:hypothetical protein
VGWLHKLLGKTSDPSGPVTRRITVKSPLVIQSPRLGVLNLLGLPVRQLIETDKAALAPLFVSVSESDSVPPVCDVLLLYARIQSDGSIEGTADEMRTIIYKSQAPIVVVASENDGNSYIAASKRGGDGRANLVMTLDRKGAVFPQFFTELFKRMFTGVTMPVAWVQLAPQNPRDAHENCPLTIFAAEISHIVFRK